MAKHNNVCFEVPCLPFSGYRLQIWAQTKSVRLIRPVFSSRLTRASFYCITATCRGVHPWGSLAEGSAPYSSSCSVPNMLLYLAQACKGFFQPRRKEHVVPSYIKGGRCIRISVRFNCQRAANYLGDNDLWRLPTKYQ
jgi:hypothetical protein